MATKFKIAVSELRNYFQIIKICKSFLKISPMKIPAIKFPVMKILTVNGESSKPNAFLAKSSSTKVLKQEYQQTTLRIGR